MTTRRSGAGVAVLGGDRLYAVRRGTALKSFLSGCVVFRISAGRRRPALADSGLTAPGRLAPTASHPAGWGRERVHVAEHGGSVQPGHQHMGECCGPPGAQTEAP